MNVDAGPPQPDAPAPVMEQPPTETAAPEPDAMPASATAPRRVPACDFTTEVEKEASDGDAITAENSSNINMKKPEESRSSVQKSGSTAAVTKIADGGSEI